MEILTAEEFMKQFETGKVEETPYEYVTDMLIEFAKIHVTAALKVASENVKFDIIEDKSAWSGQVWDDRPLPEITVVRKDSILNSYPVENIK